MLKFVNVSAYRFVSLDGLPDLRWRLRERCLEFGLKGTILLSREGINLFVAGRPDAVDQLFAFLDEIPELRSLEAKRSLSSDQPFNRMLVKIKREIISFGRPEVDPALSPAPRISPQQLKEWLDEKRPLTLLDVRNRYEIDIGTFSGSTPIGIDHFREFPSALDRLNLERRKPVVMFCTGGIRCEKAAPFMVKSGFEHVYHLDGGILKYFEQVGGEYFSGDCFVFDKRVAVDPRLQESDAAQCFACQAILSAEDLLSTRYSVGEHCPHCYVEPAQHWRTIVGRRQTELAAVRDKLPGSVPYDNPRPLNVAGAYDGYRLIEFLSAVHPHLGRENWNSILRNGRILADGKPLSADVLVRGGQRLIHLIPHDVEPPVNAQIQILYEDSAIVVVNKPAPLPVHPCGRFNRNTLVRILDLVYRPVFPRPPHRLDANTTGLVVLAKSKRFARGLQEQFERRTVEKLYLANVHGRPDAATFVIDRPLSRTPIDRGRRKPDDEGAHCLTHCQFVATGSDDSALLAIQPITGRTNQIRIHLWEYGYPIIGDPLYGKCVNGSTCPTLKPGDPAMCLHHWRIRFVHPLTNDVVSFTAPLPEWVPGEKADYLTAKHFEPLVATKSLS